jgi:hypothetical protein
LEPGFWASGRDVVITIFGFLSIVVCLVTIVLLLVTVSLVRSFQKEIMPTLQSTKATANTVQATVRVVSEMVVRPIASGVGFVTMFTKLFQTLLGGGGPRRGRR